MPKSKADSIDEKIGKRLKARRGILGITQQGLAGLLQISFQQVQKYEKGTNRLGPKRLLEMSQALSVPIHYFFQDIEGYPNFGDKQKGYDGLAEEPIHSNLSIRQEEINKLIHHYTEISQPEIRKQILNLMVTLSTSDKKMPAKIHYPSLNHQDSS